MYTFYVCIVLYALSKLLFKFGPLLNILSSSRASLDLAEVVSMTGYRNRLTLNFLILFKLSFCVFKLQFHVTNFSQDSQRKISTVARTVILEEPALNPCVMEKSIRKSSKMDFLLVLVIQTSRKKFTFHYR